MWPFTPTTTTTTTASPTDSSAPAPAAACPVDHSTQEAWTQVGPAATSNSNPPSARPLPSTTPRDSNLLSTEREISSIPRWLPPSTSSDSSTAKPPTTNDPSSTSATPPSDGPPSACPAHSTNVASPDPEEKWVYPSPSSFYSALQRKSRPANPADMPIVVPIHNAVNEKVWQDVLAWERQALGKADRDEVGSKLVSFVGKPKELSPRARWRSLIGYTPPFDRHDWLVDRPLPPTAENPNPGSMRVRYVIDFYTGRGAGLLESPGNEGPSLDRFMRPNLAFFIDCRPALDGWEGVRMRIGRGWEKWFGGGRGTQRQENASTGK